MTMKNRAVFQKDPQTHTLLNQGVAKVTSGRSEDELKTLRYELENFVCDGQYADGLTRILSTYIGHLDKTEQPGVWVSGFYGSGKSHLVKMLQHLWADTEFSDGARARGLAKLPTGVKDLLAELSTSAKRLGGIYAAAGELGKGASDSVRLALLSILFKSVGLPEQYSRASFVLWLRGEGLEGDVRGHVAAAGGDFDRELVNLYVSDRIAAAILKARPEFAEKPNDVKLLLTKQFPPNVTDISMDEMIRTIRQTLGQKGKLPCTLVVLDEVQQYIGDSTDRSKAVQDLQEQCCSQLGPSFILVATGQNALTDVGLLQRLQGRFPVRVELQDTDVEQVTREVVLKKKPSAIDPLQKLLEEHSGEIERQLASTKIGPTARDRKLLVQDYPILPVRRRFWERVLRAVDTAGTGAQLRTQLWIVYDAVKQTAEGPVGNVVSAAFLYEHIKSKVLMSGVLLQEIAENIARQQQEEDGGLRYQLCSLVFLIGQLPHDGPADAGVRADAETLSDLLVTDLTASSAALRKKVPELLEKLVSDGVIMPVEDEYRMQTREGSEWNQAFQQARTELLADPGRLAGERAQLLRTHCGELLKKSKLAHGVSKEARRFDLHFGAEPPKTDAATIPVWIRDGWEVQQKLVLNDARAAGDSAAIVYGFIPQNSGDDLKNAIASYVAATTTLNARGTPSTKEGEEARRAMETRQELARRTRDGIINDVLNDIEVYVAGGDAISGSLIDEKVQEAALRCLDRLFKEFHHADFPDWHKVFDRARKGDGDALSLVGHKGDPETHPVCKAIIEYVGSGKKGADVRKHFAAPPWGWPKDAIDAVLVVLVNAGQLQARSGTEPVGRDKLDHTTIATAEFRTESVKVSAAELIGVRGLYKKAGLSAASGQESAQAAPFLEWVRRLADDAGGDAPLPKRPATEHLADISGRVGNDQLKVLFQNKDRLTKEIEEWQGRKAAIAKREPRWRELTALLDHAGDLPAAAEVRTEVEAITTHRRLLDDPDPVLGLSDKLATALRAALNEAHQACVTAHEKGLANLEATPTWQKLTRDQRFEVLSSFGLRKVPEIAVGTTPDILNTLRKTKVSELRAIADALPKRFANALTAAAKLLEPKAQFVSLPGATIAGEDDLKAWLASAEETIREKLKDGPVVL